MLWPLKIMKIKRPNPLKKKAQKGFKGYPVATIAYYGPDNKRAGKVAVEIVLQEDSDPVDMRRFDPDIMLEAWDEFTGWPDELIEPEETDEFKTVFIPWFLFNWKPDVGERDTGLPPLPEKQIALCYLDENGERFNDFQKQLIEAVCGLPYGFFVITDVVPGKSLALRDLLLQREYIVKERTGTIPEAKGCIMFARVLTMEDTSIMFGAAPLAIPPSYMNWFIDLREKWKKEWGRLNTEFLFAYDLELRDIYFDFKDMMNNPKMPTLTNTDGDLFEIIKLHYDLLCPPAEAFAGLRPLRLDTSDEEALNEAVYSKDGAREKVSFAWMKKGNKLHSSWDNTVMGNLKIKGESLTIEVNSRKRADKIHLLVKKHLKDMAV